MKYKIEQIETDVLIVGGGLSGALAALKVKEEGLDCVVLEKSNTKRSGNAGSGIDHIFSYIPELHEKVGYSMEEMKEEQAQFDLAGLGLGFRSLNDFFVENSYDRIIGLEKYGLKFRFEDSNVPGGYRVIPQFHSVPTSFNFEGRDIKPILTKEMEKSGVRIYNRVFVYELLKDEGKVVGAIGVCTRENIIYVVRAKTTILATAGGVDRLCKSATGVDFERFHSASMNNGAGKVLAMNAGADIINMEYTLAQGGMEWLNWTMSAGCPGGTYWPCARIIDEDGNVIMERDIAFSPEDPNYKEKHQKQFARHLEGRKRVFEHLAAGELLYMDMAEATDDEIEYVKWSLSHEGKCNTLLANMDAQGISFKDIKIPYFYTNMVQTFVSCSGVYSNVKCETTVENLYAAGNEIAGMSNNSAPEAVVYGIEAGLQAAKKAKETECGGKVDISQVARVQQLVEGFYENESEDKWLDIEHAIQNIINTFGTIPHSDIKCRTALNQLEKMEKEIHLHAENPHEINRCLDVIFILQTAKAIFLACENRKENLGPFIKNLNSNAPDKAPEDVEIYGLYKDGGTYKFHTIKADL